MIGMYIFAALALLLLLVVYVMGLFNAVGDPNKTLAVKITVDEATGKERKSIGMVDMDDAQKRKRFMWFSIATLPGILFLIIYLFV